MGKRVQEMIDKFVACQAVRNCNNAKPTEITPTEGNPCTNVTLDFYGPIPRTGQYLLVVIDSN